MAAIDYAEFADDAKELIDEAGRSITLHKLSAVPVDALKPWRGTGAPGPTKVNSVVTIGAFVVPNTSIPTESRGLAFDWIDQDLLKRCREVCVVAAKGLVDLEDYNVITDGTRDYAIIWGQCLKPGSTRLLYVFGLAQ